MLAPLWRFWSAGRSGVHARVSPMLIVMSGLPGAGKSSVAEAFGRKLSSPRGPIKGWCWMR
ncbi:zeta toxin family protein [Streptomyces sp. NBC_00353]